jgi:hypothetical protein
MNHNTIGGGAMSAFTITLQDYEQAERVLAHEGARVGLTIQAWAPCWSPHY